jgi:hypothetical protein
VHPDIQKLLDYLASANTGPYCQHSQFDGAHDTAPWIVPTQVDGRIRRTAAIVLKLRHGFTVDDENRSFLLKHFDGYSVWLIAHLDALTRVESDDILKASWFSSPKAYMLPASANGGVIFLLKVKVGMSSGIRGAGYLSVSIAEKVEEWMDGVLLKDDNYPSVVFRAYPERESALPDASQVEQLVRLKTQLKRGHVEVVELGSLAKIESIPRKDCDSEGSHACCYFNPSSQEAFVDLDQAGVAPDVGIIRIEVDRATLRQDFAAIFINDSIRGGKGVYAGVNGVRSLSRMLVVIPPLYEQASVAKFHGILAAYKVMMGLTLSGLDSLGLMGHLDEPASKLFLASVRCGELVEAGSLASTGSLPYPLTCAYQAYECATEGAQMERAFKLVDAFVEFHCLCAVSVAASTFHHNAEREIAEHYNKNRLLDLGMWIDRLKSVSGKYLSLRSTGSLEELSQITASLGVASVYALDQLFSEDVILILDDLRKRRNAMTAHGPNWGNEEKVSVVQDLIMVITDYMMKTTSLWGYLRLGFCSDVRYLENGDFASLIERCGQERYGKNGIRFVSKSAIARPKTLVLYPSNEDGAFIPLLPFYFAKQIAPSLHILYHLSRTNQEGGFFNFNSYAALEADLKSQEKIAVTSPAVSALATLLKQYPYIDPVKKTERVAL